MEETGANILVVDDQVGMREGCRRALTSHGFQVTTAEHAAEGLRCLREQSFDLVLLDAMMPGMSGLELVERIQQRDPDMVCVMITGYATVDLAAQAMKQGAHDFLPKPFTSDELLTVVRRGLEARRRKLAAQEQEAQIEEAQELERARQEMARLDAVESRFMLVVVHELRNPAGAIKSLLKMIRGGYVDADEMDEYLETLAGRADQLLAMMDDLLELADLKGRRGPPQRAPVPAAEVLEEVVNDLRGAAQAKGLAVELRIEAQPMVQCERVHLRSLWTHLLDNAIRYTPQGRITLTLDQAVGQTITTVSDTGIGLSTEEVARLFEEFYRSEAAKEEVALGTGLGLPIVSQIVQIYGGTIQVESTPGVGSTFSVCLPVEVD
jgi:signal transduction histidine kinase